MFSILIKNAPAIIFVAFGLPLCIQDIHDYSVSSPLLYGAIVACWLSAFTQADAGFFRLIVAGVVLCIGALLLRFFEGRLGEADVVFMSGMAATLPYWSFELAIALACISALAVYLWLSRKGRADALSTPIPFIPSLYWGGLTVLLGGIKF